jgi:hypothetical protein
LRLFINNGGVNTTAANNSLIAELTLPATTVSEIAAQPDFVLSLNFAVPAGYRLYATIGTTVVAGFAVTIIGGEY